MVCYTCYGCRTVREPGETCGGLVMDSVSQREMRNNSGELLRRVAEGESVLVTNNGVPAAVLVPVATAPRDRLAAAGRLRVGAGLDLSRLPAPAPGRVPTEQLLDDDRG